MAGSARRVVIEFLGDDKNLSSTASSIQGKTGSLGATLAKVGKVAAIGLGAGLAVAGVAAVKFGKAAMEDQQAAALLEGQLQRSAGATKAQTAEVEKWITKQGIAKGVADDDLRPALGRLVTATGDVGKAQDLAALAMDVSAGSGKSLEAVSTALMKAQNGQISGLSRLGINTKNAAGETLTFEQATKKMADTFGGAASEKANTLQGKMDRLKLIMSETGEAIGARLLPVADRLGTILLTNVIPAIGQASQWFQANMLPALQRIGSFIMTNVVPALQKLGGWVASHVLPIFQRLGSEGPSVFARVRDKVMSLVGAVINLGQSVAGRLQPIFETLVSVFRSRVQPTLELVRDRFNEWRPTISTVIGVVGRLTGNALELAGAILGRVLPPVIRFAGFLLSNLVPAVLDGIEILARIVGGVINTGKAFIDGAQQIGRFATAVGDKIRGALTIIGQLPGKAVSALGNLGSLLYNAGSSIIQGLIDGVTSKVSALTSKLSSITKLIPDWKGPLDKDKVLLKPAGIAIMEGLISGIDSRKQKLTGVLAKLTAFIKAKGDKLRGLVQARDDFAAGFSGFSSSVFGADTSSEFTPAVVTGGDAETGGGGGQPDTVKIAATVDSLFAFQKEQEAQANQLRNDINSLLSKGLSRDLIQQMAASGSQGIAQIRLLATASASQIQAFNASNAATQSALQSAGMQTANALMEADIKAAERELKIAKAIEDGLEAWSKKQDKDTIVKVILDGKELHGSLLQIKRKGGKKLGLD